MRRTRAFGGVVNAQLLMGPSSKCLPVAPSSSKLRYLTQNVFSEFFMCVFAEILNQIGGIFTSWMFRSRSEIEPERDETGHLS